MFGQNLLDLAVKLVRNEGNLQGQARRGPSLAGVLLLFSSSSFSVPRQYHALLSTAHKSDSGEALGTRLPLVF